MATRFYLRDTYAPEAPLPGKLSTALPNATGGNQDGNAGTPFEDRALLIVKGETIPDSVLTRNSLATVVHSDQYLGRFISKPLAAQSIAANTWTVAFALSEANIDANSELMLSVYVYRPTGGVVGYIWDAHTVLGVEWGATQDGQVVTFAGSAVTAAAGDVIAIEVWRHTTAQTTAVAYLQSLYYSAKNIVDDATVSDAASYIETPQTLTFETPRLPVAVRGVFVETMGLPGPFMMSGNLYVLAENTELNPNPNWWKSTDGGHTWNEMDAANQPTGANWNDLECWWTVIDGTKLRSLHQRSGANYNNVSYFDFDTATDTWVGEATKAVTGVASTDIFTATAHGFQDGDGIKFSGLTGGTGITAGTLYYVILGNLTANTFQVSTSANGTALNFTSDLTAGSVSRFWHAIKAVQAGTISQQGVSLVQRSNGDQLAFYMRYDSAASTSAVYKKRVAGGEWGAEVLVKALVSQVHAIKGATDKIHVFVKEDTSSQHGGATNTVFQASLSTSDVFSSFEACNVAAIHGLSSCIVAPPVYFDLAGAEKIYIAWADSTGYLRGCMITDDGTPGPEEIITDYKCWLDPLETAQFQPVAGLAVDPDTKKIYCVYSYNPSFNVTAQAPDNEADMYVAVRELDGWSTDRGLVANIRMQIVSCNIYRHSAGNGNNKVLGIFYDDANGPYYYEMVIDPPAQTNQRSQAPAMSGKASY